MSMQDNFADLKFGRRSFLKLAGLAALVVGLAILPFDRVALAQSLNDLRASGIVGERFDGFAAVRDSGASGSVRQSIEAINAKRRSIYEQRAREQGVSADQVGRVYAQQIMRDAPAGTWMQDASGAWKRK